MTNPLPQKFIERKSRDSLYKQYEETRQKLQGISPKLALHAKLVKELAEIREKLDGNGVPEKRKRFLDKRIKRSPNFGNQ